LLLQLAPQQCQLDGKRVVSILILTQQLLLDQG
jgi:hypothetical protein